MREISDLLKLSITIDSDADPAKHDNLLTRAVRNPDEFKPLIEGRLTPTCITFKRLPSWLNSAYLFAKHHGFDVPEERYLGGEFFSFRVGRWCAADWWVEYFNVDQIRCILRSDYLENDWRLFLKQTTGIEAPQLSFKQMNKLGNPTELSRDWTTCDWHLAYQRNPQWTAIETKIYNILNDV
jgi:hypothetical protein